MRLGHSPFRRRVFGPRWSRLADEKTQGKSLNPIAKEKAAIARGLLISFLTSQFLHSLHIQRLHQECVYISLLLNGGGGGEARTVAAAGLDADEDGLSFRGQTFASEVSWDHFASFYEDKKTFVISQRGQTVFNILPKRCLSAEQTSTLRELFSRYIDAGGRELKQPALR